MNDPMRILKADHREVEQLMDKLAESEEGAAREKLLDELTIKLSAHMEMEEQIVYGPLAKQVGAEDEEEAEVEHNLAREGLKKLHELVDVPGFGAAVEMLKGGIGHHVKEEESELLPDLKDAVSKAEWTAMGDQIAKAKAAAGLPLPQPARRRSAKRASAKKTASKKSSAPKQTGARKSTTTKRKATAGSRSR